ncbi:Nuclease HARBI1 [Phytophthora megakarya]|uniref:Nuclease HARBI1 n=1 Tax=Phytophthora megakarya TaxID=4795 RepID=A0A225VSD2_9STRA|nr:Nuclease HARBI1 [Phytophthora megakarya]
MEIPTAVPDFFAATYLHFDQALGAIDGTYLCIEVSQDDVARFRNHKGFITTNVLIFCDWSMKVGFAHVGAEGSAHDDTSVLRWSGLLERLPTHYFVLGDPGYGLSEKVLTPFRGVRYHLKEWARRPSGRPQNA